MNKGQLSVEFLVLLAFSLLLAGLVVHLLVKPTQSSKQAMLIGDCQAAAQECAFIHRVNASYDCSFCENQCVYPNSNEEVFSGAVDCCKQGNASAIFIGSTGC